MGRLLHRTLNFLIELAAVIYLLAIIIYCSLQAVSAYQACQIAGNCAIGDYVRNVGIPLSVCALFGLMLFYAIFGRGKNDEEGE